MCGYVELKSKLNHIQTVSTSVQGSPAGHTEELLPFLTDFTGQVVTAFCWKVSYNEISLRCKANLLKMHI